MYKVLFNKFKDKLTDRRLDIYFNIIFLTITIVSVVAETILLIFYKSWLIPISCSLFSIIFALISTNIFVFAVVNKNTKLKTKDFFNYKKLFNLLNSMQPKDIDILIKILKENDINTRPKIQEAIRHFQNELLRKSKNSFSTLPVLSIAISVLGTITSSFVIASTQDLILFFSLVIFIVVEVVLICKFAKMVYKTACYSTSEYAIYERIELALSEIWFKQLIK